MIPVDVFAGRTVAVFGLARSGLAAAKALLAGGARVAAWDEGARGRDAARAEGLPLEDLTTADFSRFAALVLSPGVPLTHPAPHPLVLRAQAAGVEIIGDIELLARVIAAAPEHRRPKVAAITGTNGKSTTTALIGHVLAAAGRDVRIGGNIGVPVLDLEPIHGGAHYVLELSSYQLDLTCSLVPDVSVLLNITPDHLDRHGTMAGYADAKRRIFRNQTSAQAAVVGVDDDICEAIFTELLSQGRSVWPISARKVLGRGVYVLDGALYDALDGRATPQGDLHGARSLPGRHNAQNAAAAYAAVRRLGLTPREALDGLLSFPGLAHRMETIAVIDGVRFVNDSKATNVDAARQAMSSYPRFHWIAGGRPKSGVGDLADLFGAVEHAYLIGEAAEAFSRDLGDRAPWSLSGDVRTAVTQAYRQARAAGGPAVVLFSPACASFDQFSDFEARGEAFRAAVLDLKTDAGRGGAT